MGIPKFYRWISERYPCLSEVVRDYQIPEFDNLYLDMNGIIHVCSHPNDDDPFFRITEEKIFKDIFHYIEVLFRIVRPKKVFFMAVDGVAPRAKMNQQRGRRFRSAKEAATNEAKAIARGKELPKEERFDSNCITPGTPFMERLDEQLRYFVSRKVSTDKYWQGLRIFLSGHETPGEGEHKIMDFIRYEKSRNEYDPNTRHCLYGLDADLIMLGLCSHEPHFSLLREEVKFSNSKDKKGASRTACPEETTFHLLHLSLMREYLDMEFSELKGTLPFEYDLERIIDDWIFMGFLVGNDFIPHLPDLHIKHEVLPKLWNVYISILPSMGGYINESGELNLSRFQKYMDALACLEVKSFFEKFWDLKYLQSKRGNSGFNEANEDPADLVCLDDLQIDRPVNEPFSFPNWDSERIKLLKDSDDESDDDYEKTLNDPDFQKFFRDYKNNYYKEKMHYDIKDQAGLRELALGYVRAIQWNLHYYYHGVQSWSWFFPQHYSPFISDVTNFAGFDVSFDMGHPFLPFQQLMAVLPPASKMHVPPAYHWLMESTDSPILEFYPQDFETDLNGKTQEWESVVLIPFIEEVKLLGALAQCEQKLSAEEKARNKHSAMALFQWTSDDLGSYAAPAHFPMIEANHAKLELVDPSNWKVPKDQLVKGLCKGVRLDVYFPGYPTFKHLDFSFALEKAEVKVFQSRSRSENMILSLKSVDASDVRSIAKNLTGSTIYVGWPHLVEALVHSVSTASKRWHLSENRGEIVEKGQNERQSAAWDASVSSIEDKYENRLGVRIGETQVVVHAKQVVGRVYSVDRKGSVTLDKVYAENAADFSLQSIVRALKVQENECKLFKSIKELFPVKSVCFMLTSEYYGSLAVVVDHDLGVKQRLKMKLAQLAEPVVNIAKVTEQLPLEEYYTAYQIGQRVRLSSHVVSRLTGTVFLNITPEAEGDRPMKINIGLNLKLSKKNTAAVGYVRRNPDLGWSYSAATAEVLKAYMDEWPVVIDHITRSSGNDVYDDIDVFRTQPREQALKLKSWLEAQPCASADRETCGSPSVPLGVIKSLDKAVKEMKLRCTEEAPHMIRITTKPHLVFKPSEYIGSTLPDPGTEFALYDRVVNVRESFTVPLGARGFITGIIPGLKECDTMYEIMFDHPFSGGLSGERFCGDERGYRMLGNSLINITWGLEKWHRNNSPPSQNTWDGKAKLNGKSDEKNVWTNRVFAKEKLNNEPTGSSVASPPQPSSPRKAVKLSAVQPGKPSGFGPALLPTPNVAPLRELATPSHDVSVAIASNSREGKDITDILTKLVTPTRPKVENTTASPVTQRFAAKEQRAEACLELFPGNPMNASNRKVENSSSDSIMNQSASFTVDQFFKLIENSPKAAPPVPAVPVEHVETEKTKVSAYTTFMEFIDRQGFRIEGRKVFDEDGKKIAKLVLPTGKIVVGDLKPTQEEALESASLRALEEMRILHSSGCIVEQQGSKVPFPEPPDVPEHDEDFLSMLTIQNRADLCGPLEGVDFSQPPPVTPRTGTNFPPAPKTSSGKYLDDLEEVFQASSSPTIASSPAAARTTPSKMPSAFVPLQVLKQTTHMPSSSPPVAASSPLSVRTKLSSSSSELSGSTPQEEPRAARVNSLFAVPEGFDLRPKIPEKSRVAINFTALRLPIGMRKAMTSPVLGRPVQEGDTGKVGHSIFSFQDTASNGLALNKDSTCVVVAGRHIFKIFSIREDVFEEKANLRTGKNMNLNFSCNDVAWNCIDDHYLATAATNGSVVIWNLLKPARSKQEHVFQDHSRTVNKVCFHNSEANLLLSGSQDGTMKLFDIRQLSVALTFFSNTESVRDVQFNPHFGHQFVAVSDNGTTQIWDSRRPDKIDRQFTSHSGPVFACDWHPLNRSWLATAGRDKTIKVWNVDQKCALEHTVWTIASVGRIKWRPQRNFHIASAALVVDCSVNVWDVRRPYVPFVSFIEHKDVCTGIAWRGSDPQVFLSSSKDGYLWQHSFEDGKLPSEKTNPVALAFGVQDDLAFAAIDQSVKDLVNANGLATSVGRTMIGNIITRTKSGAPTEIFVSARSSFNFFGLQKESSAAQRNSFVGIAEGYILADHSFAELCDHNASIARKYGKEQSALTWQIFKLLFDVSENICSNPVRDVMMKSEEHSGVPSGMGSGDPEKRSLRHASGDNKSTVESIVTRNEVSQSLLNGPSTSGSTPGEQSDSEDGDLNKQDLSNFTYVSHAQMDDLFHVGELELGVGPYIESAEDEFNGQDVPEEWQLPVEAFELKQEIVPVVDPLNSDSTVTFPDPSLSLSQVPLLTPGYDIMGLTENTDGGSSTFVQPATQVLVDAGRDPPWDFLPIIAKSLEHFAEQGDVQAAASMLLVLGSRITSSIPEAIQFYFGDSEFGKTEMSDLKSLEHPTLKVPYEVLNKKFRAAQKNIDREASYLQSAVAEMERQLQSKSNGDVLPQNAQVVKLIDTILEKITTLKRKAEESLTEECDAAKLCKIRVDHLSEMDTTDEATLAVWKQRRLDRMLVEHLLRAGHYNTAVRLAQDAGIEELTNADLFLVSREVEDSLMKHETTRCLAWCHDNRSRLRKLKSSLEFNVKMQEFIELVKSGRRLEAIKHARKQFSAMEEDYTEAMKHFMGLLAMSKDTQVQPYKDMLSEDRWKYLVELFRSDNQKLYQMSNQSVFSVALQAGLSALKTPHCYKKGIEYRNPDCPVCQDPLNSLADSLPYALRARSKLICYISGLPLNEHNQPLMLPNGHVYGELALQQMAVENDDGKIMCPRTKKVYTLKECEKIYVM
ncbi:unnamed protein product [Notodromas monacha]|uniref:5'-3' exoribonuclease 2 n=1 Tax=Notodromas monacha TaxID=399045 RepID=A0A7R9GCS0_9CRUS|nr:unnamed protein product [Notodromas monacha]CAG0917946.1 unnamed protein product [Notodromas monacha]